MQASNTVILTTSSYYIHFHSASIYHTNLDHELMLHIFPRGFVSYRNVARNFMLQVATAWNNGTFYYKSQNKNLKAAERWMRTALTLWKLLGDRFPQKKSEMDISYVPFMIDWVKCEIF